MKWHYVPFTLALGWIAAAACGGRHTHGNDTNTNWMRICETSDDCGGSPCSCGVCTPTCNDAAACDSLGSDARCVSVDELVFGPCAPTTAAICLPECTEDANCSAHGPEFFCHDGTCAPHVEGHCPPVADSCPAGCDAFQGAPIDPDRSCWLPAQPLGCWPRNRAYTEDQGCAKNAETGELFSLASGSWAEALSTDPTFEECSESEFQSIHSASTACDSEPQCPVVADSCPDQCSPFQAHPVDIEGSCLRPSVPMGCWPVDAASDDAVGCAKHRDTGELYMFPSSSWSEAVTTDPAFESCSQDEYLAALASPCVGE